RLILGAEPTGVRHCRHRQRLSPAWFPTNPHPSQPPVPFIHLSLHLSYATHHKTCTRFTLTLYPTGFRIWMKQSPPKEHNVANTPKVKDMHETDKDISSKSFISGRLQHVPV